MPEINARQRLDAYWQKNLRMTAVLLAIWFTVTFGVSYFARELNFNFFGWPFSFWMASQGAPVVPDAIKEMFRREFKGKLILSGGYDAARAESDLAAGKCDLIAVGRPILANPDLVARWKTGVVENAPDMDTFYTPGPKGYTDYPAMGA